ncbi:MAG: ammonium transporter [Clostridiales bacterium]|nr:ammonium transporter [Clostridiales bacterium]
MSMESILSTIGDEVFGVWFLIGAALVFFMQCGFAMVETGFTRAKNAGNIIMKNLMDFCIGAVMFIVLGFGLMMGEECLGGLVGMPTLGLLTDYTGNAENWSSFVFNLVFCATAATIVSGAMAERTKFASYCIYSAVISAVVYPIEAGWIWNPEGWLAVRGFHDFAGSCAIHMVGGISALIGAAILGPRIGKYKTDKKTGKKVAKAIPGHSLTLGALGCFILWFGWYGFNGAAATSTDSLASIFLTTTMAPATATVVAMIFTWIKDGKPDVSMSLNASLAGLVAITAPCDCVDALSSVIIGAVSGILVVVAVEVIDKKLHVDDPVGAVAVHMVNGMWGTIAVGLFSNGSDGAAKGLFYGGGFSLLGTQLLGLVCVAAWTAVTMTIVFFVIKKTIGLRVSEEEEIKGLDATEHNLPSAYADFMPVGGYAMAMPSADTVSASSTPVAPVEKAVPVETYTTNKDAKLTKVVMIFNPAKFEEIKDSMNSIGVTGMTVTNVMGCGTQKGHIRRYRGVEIQEMNLNPKMKLEMVVSAVPVSDVIDAARNVLYTGNIGDGKIFIYDVEDVVKVRTGERGYDALQGEDDV